MPPDNPQPHSVAEGKHGQIQDPNPEAVWLQDPRSDHCTTLPLLARMGLAHLCAKLLGLRATSLPPDN